jgi:hypothetical protein
MFMDMNNDETEVFYPKAAGAHVTDPLAGYTLSPDELFDKALVSLI